MNQLAIYPDEDVRREPFPSARRFSVGAASLAVVSALLAGWVPLGFSIVIVFLFAGPHNWMEARYFLGRLPARWGKLRGFFLFSFSGVFVLTAAFALFPWIATTFSWTWQNWLTACACWNTVFVTWLLALIHLRSRQHPRREWSWTFPAGGVLIGLGWYAPIGWELAMVYLHPLMAMWILDREILRSRREWSNAYRRVLLCVPLLLGLLWWRLAHTPDLPGNDALSFRIAQHAGGGILTGVSTHLLVATHTFLEMMHYGIWLIAIPIIAIRTAPWRIDVTPLGRRSNAWRTGLTCFFALSSLVVLGLWSCFIANYPITRDVYFTVAMLHVLAEAPFLLRLL